MSGATVLGSRSRIARIAASRTAGGRAASSDTAVTASTTAAPRGPRMNGGCGHTGVRVADRRDDRIDCAAVADRLERAQRRRARRRGRRGRSDDGDHAFDRTRADDDQTRDRCFTPDVAGVEVCDELLDLP